VVFAPGWSALGLLRSVHIHASNSVGVLVTVGLWWFLFVAVGSVWEWRTRQLPPNSRLRRASTRRDV
jgi:thiosulfate reductase cytochrome b subunit